MISQKSVIKKSGRGWTDNDQIYWKFDRANPIFEPQGGLGIRWALRGVVGWKKRSHKDKKGITRIKRRNKPRQEKKIGGSRQP